MNPILATTLVAGMTWLARIEKGEGLTTNHVIAFFVMAVILGFINTIDADLGNAFAWLVVVGVMFAHIPTIEKLVRP